MVVLIYKPKNTAVTCALSPPRGALCVLPKSVSLLLLTKKKQKKTDMICVREKRVCVREGLVLHF